MLVIGGLVFHAEHQALVDGVWMDSEGEPSEFQSILDGAYFTLVVVSTIGYCDMAVKTPLGKCVASLGGAAETRPTAHRPHAC